MEILLIERTRNLLRRYFGDRPDQGKKLPAEAALQSKIYRLQWFLDEVECSTKIIFNKISSRRIRQIPPHGLRTIVHVELAVDSDVVLFDGLLADVQPGTDLFIEEPLGQQL